MNRATSHTVRPRFFLATGAMGALALTLYAATVRPYPVPGMSAQVLVKHLWLDSFPASTHFAWGVICRYLSAIAPSHTVLILNIFSALCGAVAVWLLCVLNLRMLRAVSPRRRDAVHLACAAGAGLYFALSAPMWLVSSRAHPLSFDVMLLLGAVVLLLDYGRKGRSSRLYTFAFLYGLGLVEYAGFAWLAMPAILMTAGFMIRHRHFDGRHAAHGLAWVLLGLSMCVFGVWALLESPAAVWMDAVSPFGLLRSMLSAQWGEFGSAMSGAGWMIGALISLPPFLVCFAQTRKRGATRRHAHSLALYVVTSALLVLVAFQTPLSPWYHHGERTISLLPYVWMSSTFALALNFWFGFAGRQSEAPPRRGLRISAVPAVILPLLVVASASVTYPMIRATYAASLYACATHVLEAMGARTLLLTDGSLDRLLRIAAREQGRDLVVLSIPENMRKSNRRALVAHFSSPRLQGLAEIGLVPLVREMIRTDDDIFRKLAVQPSDTPWREAGFKALPDRGIYLGSDGEFALDLDEHFRQNDEFWQAVIPGLVQTESNDPLRAPLARHVRTHISGIADDLGVFFQIADRGELARRAHETARRAEVRSASALVDLRSASEELGGDSVADLMQDLGHPGQDVMDRRGSIHDTAEPTDATVTPEVARHPIPEDLRQALIPIGEVYKSGDANRCRELLDDLSNRHPEDPLVWFLRGAVASEVGDEQGWLQSWEFMSSNRFEWPVFLVIEARRMLQADRISEALDLFDRAIIRSPQPSAILGAAAQIAFAAGDMERLDRYLAPLLSLDPSDPWANYALGTTQFQRGDLDLAESSYRVAADRLDVPHAANNLAWLLVIRGEYEEALAMADRALRIDPDFLPAWDTRGMALLRLDRLDEAKAALDRALALSPWDWDARLHSSMALSGLDRRDEALAILRGMESAAKDVTESQIAEYDSFRKRVGLSSVRE